MMIAPYCAYAMAEALALSGIVAGAYTRPLFSST